MSARRGASGLSGVLLVDKPQGLTSHDVVARVRRVTGERRVGHAGTLDPMATGLLVVLVGPATRLASYLTAAEKCYIARIAFGSQTDTDDAEGRVIATAQVDAALADAAYAEDRVATLAGTHQQVPPAFSAIKRDGVTAYKAARAGDAIELEARTIEVKAARLLELHDRRGSAGLFSGQTGDRPEDDGDPGASTVIEWDVELSVSKGTYIRSIARDLGVSLGTLAHLSALRRTTSGAFRVEDAIDVATLESLDATAVAARFTDPLPGLDMPVLRVDDETAAHVATGRPLPALHYPDVAPQVAVVHGDRLLAIYRAEGDRLKAETVLQHGVVGVRS